MEAAAETAQPAAEPAIPNSVASLQPDYIDTRGTMQPERALSIKEAWKATIAEHGPLTYDEPEAPVAEAKPEETEEAPSEEKKPAKAERGKDGKFAKAEKAEAKPAEEKPEPEAEAAPEDEEEEPAQKVGVRDLVHERRKLREKFERRERQLEATHQQRAQQLHQEWQRISPLAEVAKAIEHGDFDAIAAGLGKFLGNDEVKDWNTLNSEALKAIQSPVYKKMRDLERRQEAERRERAEYEQAQRQTYQQQQAEAQRREWVSNITNELSEDEDPAIPALIDARPQMAQLVFSVQKQHWDDTNGEVLEPRRALAKVLENVKDDLAFWSEFIAEHEATSKLVKKISGAKAPSGKGNQAASTPAANGDRKTATSERQGAKAPKNVSHTRAAAPSPAAPLEGKALIKHWSSRIQEDFDGIR